MSWIKTNTLWLLLALYAVFATVVILSFTGTGDSGDSVLHFLYAQSAPEHPELYFNHWGKPVFTLLASPFAQFGFLGMKVFNSIVVLLTVYFTYRSVELMQIKRPVIAVLVIVCAPLLILHTFSGLTEPLFAMFISWGLFLVLRKKWVLACIVISFLPFVRSEGLLVISAFGLYFLAVHQWKKLPLLLIGHAVYSLAGWFYYGDLLWVFTKIPYASTTSIYGHGNLFQFVNQLPFVVGVPSAILLVAGLFVLLGQLIRGKFHSELQLIVLYGFLCYFVAHSLFWYFGIFNSMGLNRVLLGVMPFMAIIALVGANALLDLFKNHKRISVMATVLLMGIIFIFPVLDNPSAVHWNRDMNLSSEQQVAKEAATYVLEKEGKDHLFLYSATYLSVALKIDHFDPSKRMDLNPGMLSAIQKGDIIIWDSWFSVVDSQVPQELLDQQKKLRKLKTFYGMQQDRAFSYIVYIVE